MSQGPRPFGPFAKKPSERTAFTLVELLVVVAIIVILLALLMPALDKAIYQAELAQCSGQQKAIVSSVQIYAAANGRRYPHRLIDDLRLESYCIRTNNSVPTLPPYDDMPVLRSMFPINRTLNDPFTDPVDFEGSRPDSVLYIPYSLWFGFRYEGEKGMYRLGDRLTWTDGDMPGAPVQRSFGVLVSDFDAVFESSGVTGSSHPDSEGRAAPEAPQDGTNGAGTNWTYTRWTAFPNTARGRLDNNIGFDDGSVRRYTGLRWDEWKQSDRKLVRASIYGNPAFGSPFPQWYQYLPIE